MTEFAAALDLVASGEAHGKVVLTTARAPEPPELCAVARHGAG